MAAAFYPLLRLLLAAFVAGVLASCADPKSRAADVLRRSDQTLIRWEAAVLMKELFAPHRVDFIVVQPKQWPRSFVAFSPIRVGAYRDGISLALQSSSASESGLYIVPLQMDLLPSSKRGTRFERLAEGIYWYSFGE